MKTAFRHVAWGIAFAGAGPLQTLAQGQGNEATEIVSVKQVVTEIVTIDGPPPQSSIVELVPMSSSAAVFVPPESAVTTPEATDTNVAVTADPSSAGSGARGSGCAMEVTFTVCHLQAQLCDTVSRHAADLTICIRSMELPTQFPGL